MHGSPPNLLEGQNIFNRETLLGWLTAQGLKKHVEDGFNVQMNCLLGEFLVIGASN